MSSITKGRTTSRTSGRDKAKGHVGLAVVTLIAAGLVLMTVLAACGSGSDEPTQAPAPETASPEQAPTQDGATLLEARCSTCHSADRARQVNKTRDGWDQTVTTMIDRGAQLTEAEKVVLVDYLTETYGPQVGQCVVHAARCRVPGNIYHGYLILLEADRHLWPILAPLPEQLVACYMGVGRGIDPDFPRNLGKTLKVDQHLAESNRGRNPTP